MKNVGFKKVLVVSTRNNYLQEVIQYLKWLKGKR